MKIFIEDDDGRVPNGYKSVTYGETCDLCTAEDWDYVFENLQEYIEELKLKKMFEKNLGKQLFLQAKVDTLEKIVTKYATFVEIAKDSRFNDL